MRDRASRLELRRRARALRRKGLSYKEIREKISIPKSTLSLWLKDVPLAPEDRRRLYTKQINLMSRGVGSQRERRLREIETIIEKAMGEIANPISEESFKLFGAALYWAEGSKTTELKITNSDPRMILFMVRWLKKVFNIDPSILKAHLNIYSQQNDIELKKFWSDLTDIPFDRFGKSYIKPTNKGHKKNTLYYGTMQIYVPKSVDLKHRIFGWIKAILQNFEKDVSSVERKWISLKQTPRAVNLEKI